MNRINVNRKWRMRSAIIAGALAPCFGASAATPIVDQYSSVGDNLFIGSFLPEDSPASIAASFDLMKNLYGTRRIYWRGLQESSYIDTPNRPENVVINKVIQNSRDLLNNQNLNAVAVQAAHDRGMQIWGATQLFDWGVPAKDPIFYGYPGEYQTTMLANNPQWSPVDKYNDQRQAGNIELAYPDARQAIVNWTVNEVNKAGYDGVFFMTYNENYSTSYADQYGFSAPVVADYKNLYGVDITKAASFDRQKWYDLRGSYTTTFLSQMKSALTLDGNKKLGMAISQPNPNIGTIWGGEPFPDIGNMTMDYKTWAQQHTVDELMVWGSNPDTYNTITANVAGTNVETSILTSGIYSAGLATQYNAGVPLAGAMNEDKDYLLLSNLPTQPLSSLTSSDVYKRMHVLAQIQAGQTTATAAQVTPLLNDSNIITRRLALRALGVIKDPTSVPLIEAALSDPENSIRTAAVYALIDNNRAESAQAILDSIAQYGNAPLIEGAVAVLRNITTDLPVLQNAMSSTNANVRATAMRSIAGSSSAITPSLLPTLQAGLTDSEPYVRAFAVDAIGRVSSTPAAVQTLTNNLTSPDPILSDRSAAALTGMLKAFDSAAVPQRSQIVSGITTLFKQFGDDSARVDSDWGYEPVGNSLYGLVPDGFGNLQTSMNQRSDRDLSLNAWQIIYEHQTPGQLTTITEAQDLTNHFKKPRWDTAIAASDSFNTKVNGSQINGQIGENGQTWTVSQGNVADEVVQSAISNGGLALKTIRRAGGSHQITLASDSFNGMAAGLTTVTAKGDWYRPTTTDATAFGLDIGPGIEAQILIDGNSFYRVWQTDGTQTGGTYLQTNVKAGVGGWETVEVVANLGLVGSGSMLPGTYNVFLSRDGNDSLGGLGRTLIASNVPIHSIAERSAEQLFISNQPNGLTDVTTYWDNVSLNVGPGGLAAFPMKVDVNGGALADPRPTNSGFSSWDNLPSNKSGSADNGYGTKSSTSRQIWTAGVTSGSVTTTISSVDISSGSYNNDHPLLNSRDATVVGREFNGSGSFTPTKDSLYRDHAFAEVGTNTVNNGTNHRMEVAFQGLDANTTYQVKLYAYDNATQRSVNVFTDVTSNSTIALPSGDSATGTFTPGEGAAGTQWAPSGQYIDGTTVPTFPTTDDFRSLLLYLTSDANGKIVLDETTVTGLSGTTQTLPILNGYEINNGQNTWNGAPGASWNTAGSWVENSVPNGKGRNATFAWSGGSVNVTTPVSVGFINFTGSNYTIGGGTVTLDDNSVNSTISGSTTGRVGINLASTSSFAQVISAPLVLAKDTTVTMSRAEQTLTISNLQPSQAWLTKSGPGTLAVNNVRTNGLAVNGGKVSIIPGRGAAGTSVAGALTITSGAALDLNDQDMIVDYTGATPAAAIRSALASGYNSGAWTGLGLTSSVAAAIAANPLIMSKTGLGYAEASAVLNGATVFSGQTIDDTAVLIRYTYLGDSNLDGTVNALDFNALATNFGHSGTQWAQGDYNYDGTVNSADFVLLSKGFGSALADLPVVSGALVPEPATLGLMGLALTGLFTRRRRELTR